MKRENVLIILSMLVSAFFLAKMFDSGNMSSGNRRSQELIYSDWGSRAELFHLKKGSGNSYFVVVRAFNIASF